MAPRFLLRIALVLPVLCGWATDTFASDVWTVGPGGQFASLQAGVDAAADGDIVLVKPGSYGATTVTAKGLTIAADTGAGVTVNGGLRLEQTAPAQTIVLVGVSATGWHHKVPGLSIRQCQGPVRITGGTFTGGYGYNPYPVPPDSHPSGWPGVWITNSSTVSLSKAHCVGGPGGDVWDWWQEYPTGAGAAGVFVRSTQVALYGCDLDGGRGGTCFDVANLDGADGGDGLYSTQGFVFASGSSFDGGHGGSGGDSNGLKVGGCGARGGDGIHLEGASADGQLLDDVFTPGPGGYPGYYAMYCSGQAPPGAPVLALAGATTTTLPGTARGFAIESPARELDTPTMTFTGSPGDEVRLDFHFDTRFLFVPTLHGVLLTRAPPFSTAIPLGVVAASGTLQVPWHTVRELGPAVDGVVRHLQGWSTDALGQVFVADHQALVLLDAGF